MALGEGGDQAPLVSLIRKCAGQPRATETPQRLWGFTGQGDELAPRLRAKGHRYPRSRGFLETLGPGPSGALQPVTTPVPDRGAGRAEAACHDRGREVLRQQANKLCPETQALIQ